MTADDGWSTLAAAVAVVDALAVAANVAVHRENMGIHCLCSISYATFEVDVAVVADRDRLSRSATGSAMTANASGAVGVALKHSLFDVVHTD